MFALWQDIAQSIIVLFNDSFIVCLPARASDNLDKSLDALIKLWTCVFDTLRRLKLNISAGF